MLRKLLHYFLILLFFSSSLLKAQERENPFWSKYVSNYSENEYGKDLNAQNWSVTQDTDGFMYFGNSYSVLKFDGIHWSSIPISQKSGYVVSLLSIDGLIYWGYNGDFGVIETSDNGAQISRSFLDNVPELDRYFSRVWKIYAYQDRIVFFTQETIFIYNPQTDSLELIYPDESFHMAFVVNDELYVRDRAYGLKKFDGKQFQKVLGGEIFHNEGVFGIIPIAEDRMMIITQVIGLYTFDNNGVRAIESPDIEKLNQQQIIGSLKLKDGNIALNTESNGVIIINQKGEIVYQINQGSGIADNDVKQVFQDDYDNLWMATNNGISMVNYSSPISLFLNNDKSGLYGSVNNLAFLNNRLYVGTTTGLYTYSSEDDKVFEPVEGLSKNITALTVQDSRLFIGTSDAIYMMTGQELRRLATMSVSSILYSQNYTRLYVIGENGLAVFQSKMEWQKQYEDKTISIAGIGTILQTDDKKIDHIWIGTMSKGLWHLSVAGYLSKGIKSELYNEDDDLPAGWVKPFIYKDILLAGTSKGLYQLERVNLIEDGKLTEYKPVFSKHSLPSLDSGVVTSLINIGQQYYTVYNGIVGFNTKKSRFSQIPFLSLELGKINSLITENENVVWIGANGGLARVDLSQSKDYSRMPDCSLDKISFISDSVLCYKPDKIKQYGVDYRLNSFSIQFSSRYNENGKLPLFSFKLEGYDEDWSPWLDETIAKYKKLSPGEYVFRVRAKNIYGIESEVTTVSIRIMAPWYLTWWAYFIYLIIFALVIVGVVKAYTYRLKQKNIQLEEIITERTHEISEKKDEIEKQRDLIEAVHEEIQSSIEYAKRIQTAVLPQQEFNLAIIKEYFILFKPKDVVSGDFYWAKKNGDFLVLAVADCTGHGVPGAFMSMLGISLLNEIVGREQGIEAGEILNQLRDGVVHSLRQSADSADVRDGMDISLVSINMKTGELNWAGAHNPLFVLSKTKPIFSKECVIRIHESKDLTHRLYDLKPDKMPIAISGRMQPFATHYIKLKEGDTIYMFSDGYIDQFGGPKGKKLMIKAFRNMLLDSFNHDLNTQKQAFESGYNEWLSYTDSDTGEVFSQIDDICIMGVRF
ncbi:MAG: hypothetical protein DRI84_09365 [Bacteroidetes bacterium]|nr:MAG: hypothetical protein DRI84_09365 [Bacteroidota bacterium]